MNDERLRRAFRELREQETAWSPPFRSLSSPKRRPSARKLWIARASVLLLLVGALLISWPKKPASSESIADWTSPTDFLLEPPAPELLESVPEIFEPVPDYSDALASPEKGVAS
jgi:hypothetical protein